MAASQGRIIHRAAGKPSLISGNVLKGAKMLIFPPRTDDMTGYKVVWQSGGTVENQNNQISVTDNNSVKLVAAKCLIPPMNQHT